MLTWLFTTKSPLRNQCGEVIGVEGFSRDAQHSLEISAPFHAFRGAIEYVQKHPANEVNVEDLARLSCMSLSTFERKFKEHFSLTPKQYILHMQMHEAYRQLSGAQSVAHVAQETGFGEQSNFIKQFRSVVGITPKQYQRSVAATARRVAR
jgi:AraC-like DNA-binding protein